MAQLVKAEKFIKDGSADLYKEFFVDPKSRVIYFMKRMDGRLHQFSTKAKEFANAKLKKEIRSGKNIRTLISTEISAYIDVRDAAAIRGDIDMKTMGVIRRSLGRAKEFWGDLRPEEITDEKWLEFVKWHEANYPKQTLFNVRKYFKSLCKYMRGKVVNGRPVLLADPRLFDPNATRERKARKKRKSRILTKDEINAILAASNQRDKTIILLMYTMGFRIDEACGLRWDNLDLSPTDPVYKFGEDDNKAGHEGLQSLSTEVYEILKAWPRTSEYVFPQKHDVSKRCRPQMIDWKAIKKTSEVTWSWTAHTFRHTCLTELFTNVALSQAAIMKCYRISLRTALEHYIHLDKAARTTLRDAIILGVKQ